ncbi:alpha/beta fold hydrolase [Brevibacillus laterosporus]|uniref:alpha/beta fold hydrolase n=1 Tax=Brevibacillus laterosporus TaxID=1465 RepID=UPI000CE435E0|nr:alpha/beta hydrolase [Brevibacillus laterosporus]MED1665497.1 alpha/beta hydrolase [Brevibacillus laterosporus]MED1670818.1 alpha/beta hydrolase [Brevibacillus laterosporus]MED1718192.1 alpha/beta hydrolase [Brevibacillus laterosporus]PPA81921.1 alpha/beta hydrolase [Brevibacillus laterosporus]
MNEYKSVSSDGFELNYCIKGFGKPVLVVGSSIYYPRLFSEDLYKKFQFIFLDHRGFVKPPRALEPEDYRLDKVLDDIETARQALDLKDFIILGHSGHAFMALEYAKKYPEAVQKVVLLNSAPTNSQERQQQSSAFFYKTASLERKRQFEKDIAFLESDIKKDPERRFVHMCIRMGAQSFYDYTFDAAYMWEDVYTHMPIIDHLWGEAFEKRNLIQSLANFKKPVFIGLGRYDYLVAPVSLWDSIDDTYGNVKKVIFEYSGHNPMFEEPQQFNKSLIEWMNEDK